MEVNVEPAAEKRGVAWRSFADEGRTRAQLKPKWLRAATGLQQTKAVQLVLGNGGWGRNDGGLHEVRLLDATWLGSRRWEVSTGLWLRRKSETKSDKGVTNRRWLSVRITWSWSGKEKRREIWPATIEVWRTRRWKLGKERHVDQE